MSETWQSVPLSQMLSRSETWINLEDDNIYQEVTIRLWGKGVIERRKVQGLEIGSARRLAVRPQQFILSRIDARNGALGLVPPELDGAVVSNDFPVFDVDTSRVLPEYLDWLSKTRSFVEICKSASEGTTNRVRLKEERFLAMRVSLPPLAEQRRIVARIEELAARIEEARKLRTLTTSETKALAESSISKVLNAFDRDHLVTLRAATDKIGSGSTPDGGRAAYPTHGIPFVRSMNVRMRRFQWDDIAYISQETHQAMKGTVVRPNDVLLNITGASIGRVACAPADLKTANVNQHVAIIRPKAELHARFLMYWLSQVTIQEYINSEQKGATRQGFTKAQIEALEIPLLPMQEQIEIVTYLDNLAKKHEAGLKLQTESTAELNALLPSVLDRAFQGKL